MDLRTGRNSEPGMTETGNAACGDCAGLNRPSSVILLAVVFAMCIARASRAPITPGRVS
jgi:hypothetical protein